MKYIYLQRDLQHFPEYIKFRIILKALSSHKSDVLHCINTQSRNIEKTILH